MFDILATSLELGLFYSLAIFGVFITFRILSFPDLTVDGSFVTGAAIAALALKSGQPALVALVLGFIAGFAAGALTAWLHIKVGIGKILSGIVSLSMLYTINLRLMGRPNLSLLNQENILAWLKTPINDLLVILYLTIIVLVAKFFVDWFLKTEIGMFIRGTGDSEATVRSFGRSPNVAKFIGLSLSNAFVGLSGAFVGQYQGFVDINMGIGLIILGIAGYMVGEALMGRDTIGYLSAAVVIGSIVYQLIISISLRLGLPATDLKFITALIVVVALVARGTRKTYGALSRY